MLPCSGSLAICPSGWVFATRLFYHVKCWTEQSNDFRHLFQPNTDLCSWRTWSSHTGDVIDRPGVTRWHARCSVVAMATRTCFAQLLNLTARHKARHFETTARFTSRQLHSYDTPVSLRSTRVTDLWRAAAENTADRKIKEKKGVHYAVHNLYYTTPYSLKEVWLQTPIPTQYRPLQFAHVIVASSTDRAWRADVREHINFILFRFWSDINVFVTTILIIRSCKKTPK